MSREVPPESPDPLPALPSSGIAYVQVTVADGFGAPLAGAAVRIDGVVMRDATTNEAGLASFADLPDGRYDIVASQKGFVSSPPRVIDLSGATTTSVALTLKPTGPFNGYMSACGGDARTLEELAAPADAVALVAVADQRSYQREPSSPDDTLREIMTSSRVRTLQSFKVGPFAPGPGSVVNVVQPGGRIDRGGYIDSFNFDQLPPLNVGDDYVLFLYRDEKGALTIYGAEHGAFRIRNGRVEPLGSGDIARAWRGRSAEKFLEALRQRIR